MFKLTVDDYAKLIEDIGVCFDKLSQHSYPILRQHSRPTVASIFGGNQRTIRMLVSVRTDRTDEIIVPTEGKFYTDCTCEYPNEHPLDDTVMLAAKSFVDKFFDCSEHIQEVIIRTTVYPVGACVLNEQVYVYVNIVIDHTLKDEEFFKLKDCHFESIEALSPDNQLEVELISKLIIVKGDKKNV